MQSLPREYTSMTRLLRVLLWLLVFLAGSAALYVIYTVLHRFGQVLFLFGVGAILAYVLTPLVNGFRHVFISRWLAILMVYVFLIMSIALLAILLVTPFIQQSQGLVTNLQNPAPSSLETVGGFQATAQSIYGDLQADQQLIAIGQNPPPTQLSPTRQKIRTLQHQLLEIKLGSKPAGATVKQRNGQPEPQTQVPPRYTTASLVDVVKLNADFSQATATRPVNPTFINLATKDAAQT